MRTYVGTIPFSHQCSRGFHRLIATLQDSAADGIEYLHRSFAEVEKDRDGIHDFCGGVGHVWRRIGLFSIDYCAVISQTREDLYV